MMPIIRYEYSQAEIYKLMDILIEMDVELGFIVNDITDKKMLKKANKLSGLHRKMESVLKGEYEDF
jgi:hypothetical protein